MKADAAGMLQHGDHSQIIHMVCGLPSEVLGSNGWVYKWVYSSDSQSGSEMKKIHWLWISPSMDFTFWKKKNTLPHPNFFYFFISILEIKSKKKGMASALWKFKPTSQITLKPVNLQGQSVQLWFQGAHLVCLCVCLSDIFVCTCLCLSSSYRPGGKQLPHWHPYWSHIWNTHVPDESPQACGSWSQILFM